MCDMSLNPIVGDHRFWAATRDMGSLLLTGRGCVCHDDTRV